ncbi:dienelactone hydrolase family protein [Beggiatoa leptomitoformis]|uniref:Alpha/beta fold hydrolase n=1 Tax=Beggiatoa leptomitoformis TaxID=288004 RepID=A0A2N9YHW4_9GAMM|nr:alpha/beta fold hydrolase [Beggiatoa leptomitoformis]ALG67642.1 alpha/beta fold hydrolase [Beggiatoa leptomitoformis]AUI70122.1 alpha/beta fold hydrolase [Beggiatoa leptomitoformis]
MELTTPEGEIFNTYVAGSKKANKGLLIIHDSFGVSDYNREWANYFAEQGYYVLVVDLYNGQTASNTKEASELLRTLNQDVVNRKLNTALESLKTAKRKVGLLGWSFGGLQAQHFALQQAETIRALAIYYCRIVIDRHKVESLHSAVLAIFAETEKTWPDKQAALEHVMSEADKIVECYSYDADAGFINPDSLNYDSEAAEDTRKKTLAFFNKMLA